MRRAWIACLLTAAAAGLLGAGEARADGHLHQNGPDSWSASGTLDGVRPGDRKVRWLFVSQLGPGTAEGLAPLAQFKQLRTLELEYVSGVDLRPLAALHLEALSLSYVRDVDLAPLAEIPGLRFLVLGNVRNVHVPPRLALPSSLRVLAIDNDGWKETGEPVKALIEAIDWTGLGELRSLDLDVGGAEEIAPISVDLGFLRGLPKLVDLDIFSGVHHHGATRSPLSPPFAGLPPRLKSVRLDAWQPGRVQRALRRRYPRAAVYVEQRYRYNPAYGMWALLAPTKGVPVWSTYGRFWEVTDGRYGETEYEAVQAVRRRLRRAAPRLLKRLDFDPEADGTGVSARRRRDLVRLFRIVGIR